MKPSDGGIGLLRKAHAPLTKRMQFMSRNDTRCGLEHELRPRPRPLAQATGAVDDRVCECHQQCIISLATGLGPPRPPLPALSTPLHCNRSSLHRSLTPLTPTPLTPLTPMWKVMADALTPVSTSTTCFPPSHQLLQSYNCNSTSHKIAFDRSNNRTFNCFARTKC